MLIVWSMPMGMNFHTLGMESTLRDTTRRQVQESDLGSGLSSYKGSANA